MAINPDGIPRYAPPTPAELEEMFGEQGPADPYERMDECDHRTGAMVSAEEDEDSGLLLMELTADQALAATTAG